MAVPDSVETEIKITKEKMEMEQVGDELGVFESFNVKTGESMGRGSPELLLGIHEHPDVGPQSPLWLRAAMRYYTWRAPHARALEYIDIEPCAPEGEESRTPRGARPRARADPARASRRARSRGRGRTSASDQLALIQERLCIAMQEIITTLQAPAGDTAVKRKRADKKRPDKKADKERPRKKTKVCDPKKGEWADGTDVGAYIREQLTKISAKKNLSALTTAKEDLLVDLILGMMPRSEAQTERICRAVRLWSKGAISPRWPMSAKS